MLQKILQKLVYEELHANLIYNSIGMIFKTCGLKTAAEESFNIAEEELEHVEELSEMAKSLNIGLEYVIVDARLISTETFQNSDQALQFLKALELEAVQSYEDATDQAIMIYPELKQLPKLFKHILEEEKEHFKKFEWILENCKTGIISTPIRKNTNPLAQVIANKL